MKMITNFSAPDCAPFRKNLLNCLRASSIFLDTVLVSRKKLLSFHLGNYNV